MNLLSKAKAFIGARARLWIEYLLIGVVVALAGYAVNSYLQQRSLAHTVTDLSAKLGGVADTLKQQVQANRDQDAAIAGLKALRETDSKALDGLQQRLGHATAQDAAIRTKLAELERTNAAAKSLLDLAVPDDVGCVLDGRPCAPGDHPHKN
jgi:hypothetical protein